MHRNQSTAKNVEAWETLQGFCDEAKLVVCMDADFNKWRQITGDRAKKFVSAMRGKYTHIVHTKPPRAMHIVNCETLNNLYHALRAALLEGQKVAFVSTTKGKISGIVRKLGEDDSFAESFEKKFERTPELLQVHSGQIIKSDINEACACVDGLFMSSGSIGSGVSIELSKMREHAAFAYEHAANARPFDVLFAYGGVSQDVCGVRDWYQSWFRVRHYTTNCCYFLVDYIGGKGTDNLAVPSSMFGERVEQLKRHTQMVAERQLKEETAARRVGYARPDENLSEWIERIERITADVIPPKDFQENWKLNRTEKVLGTKFFELAFLKRAVEDGHELRNFEWKKALEPHKITAPKRATIEDVAAATYKPWPSGHRNNDAKIMASWSEAEKIKSLVHIMFHIEEGINIQPLLENISGAKLGKHSKAPSLNALKFKITSLRLRFCDVQQLKQQRADTWDYWLNNCFNNNRYKLANSKPLKEHNNMFHTLTEKIDLFHKFLAICCWKEPDEKGQCDDNKPMLPNGKDGAVFKTAWVKEQAFLSKCKVLFKGKDIKPKGKKCKCKVHQTMYAVLHWFENEPPFLITGLHLQRPSSKKNPSFWKLELLRLKQLADIMNRSLPYHKDIFSE